LLNYKCKFCNFQRIFESVMIFTSQCNFGVLQGVRENFERGLVRRIPSPAPILCILQVFRNYVSTWQC
jgi:hypothetical protein